MLLFFLSPLERVIFSKIRDRKQNTFCLQAQSNQINVNSACKGTRFDILPASVSSCTSTPVLFHCAAVKCRVEPVILQR